MKCRVRLYEAKLPTDRNSIYSLTYITSLNMKYQYDSQIKNIEEQQMFVVKLNEENALGKGESSDTQTYTNINYLTMIIYDESIQTGTIAGPIRYYVDRIVRNTKESIIIYASLDVCNFFNDTTLDNNFTDGCLIERAFLNRWQNYLNDNNPYMQQIVDFHKEDFDIPTKYLESSTKINDRISGKWYAIYYSDPANTKTGVRTFLVPESTANFNVKIDTQASINVVADTMYIIRAIDNMNATVTIGSETFTLTDPDEHLFIYNNGGNIMANKYKYSRHSLANNWNELYAVDTNYEHKENLTASFASSVQPLIYYTISDPLLIPHVLTTTTQGWFPFLTYIFNKADTTTSSQNLAITGLSDIPRTNSRIIKIISLPYFPCFSTTENHLRHKNVHDDFMDISVIEVLDGKPFGASPIQSDSYEVRTFLESKPTSYNIAHNIIYETKFLNSDYDEIDFEYGPYKYTITPEMYNIVHNTKLYFDFNYTQALLKSNFAIEFTNMSYQFKTEFRELPNIESNFIISDIDNEVPVFNSDYINYMKNGYNYDKESIARQTVKGQIGIATGLGGAALGALAGGPVGAAAAISLGASTVNQMSNIILSKIQAEANLEYKINSYKNAKTAVAGVSDLELRKAYQADALYLRGYKISDSLRKLLYNYWRLFGYRINEYANPYELVNANKRHRFNYIKLSSVEFSEDFLKEYGKFSDLIDIYKNKLLEGIYIYYRKSNGEHLICDFDKYYENLEEGIVWEGYNE